LASLCLDHTRGNHQAHLCGGAKQDKGTSHLGHGDIPRPNITAESVSQSRSSRYPRCRLHIPHWAAGCRSVGRGR
jgi:hypothetical protein